MLTTIISCIIANILTIVIIGAAIYFSYKKNQEKIDEKVEEIKYRIESAKEILTEAKDSIAGISTAIQEIKDKLSFTNLA